MYAQFFGLEEEPFRLTPDPRYLFLSPKHAEALAHLRLGLTETSGFICITGDVGTGKTTVLRLFLSELGPNVAAAYTFVPPLTALELVRRICREFGLEVANQTQGELVDELHIYLIAQRAAGRTCVLILDEAQALSIELLEQLRLLLNLETSTEKLLRIVLVGQPELRRLLLDPGLAQLNQRITLRWHLGPLSRRETMAYVRHRLSVASNGGAAAIFTGPALRMLHSVSSGIPRLINMIGHRALLTAYVSREALVTRRVLAHAYREIQAVPLPGTLSTPRKAAIAAAGLAIGVFVVAVAGPHVDWLLAPPAPAALPAAAPLAVAAIGSPPVEEPALAPPAPPPPQPLALPQFADRLLATDAQRSVYAGAGALLAAWGSAPLAADEARRAEDIESVAWRRGLQTLLIVANRSMLRLLDLPALLPLRVPGSSSPRYVCLLGFDGPRVVVSVEGTSVVVDAEMLDRYWPGDAQVLWRDFDELGPALSQGTRGVRVLRLQQILRKTGARVESSGIFDDATRRAVLDFQRAHRLAEDGVVGTFTRIALYAAAGGYQRPTLAAAAEGHRS
jgi:general secretion pathway protein A